jgi:hypothetical protein
MLAAVMMGPRFLKLRLVARRKRLWRPALADPEEIVLVH